MNKTSLSSLYRRLTATATPALDAEALVAAADGTLPPDRRDAVATVLASSSAEAKLAQVLRALQPASESLASGVARTERETTHRRHGHVERRVASGRRFASVTRWTAMAACLVAVVGVLALRHHAVEPGTMPTQAVAHTDRIFTANDHIFSDVDLGQGKTSGSDELFRTDFSSGG